MVTDCPKPFLKVAGKPILAHTISRFLEVDGVIQILISSATAYISEIQEIISSFDGKISFRVVEGGSERQLSIYNALQYVSEETELIAVHDAVRPFIRAGQIEKCSEAAHKFGGAVVGVPAKDTIKKVNEEAMVTGTPDRSCLWQAQTPQIFQKKWLLKAYDSAQKK
jgi:2-C-methyl-D-erythritol 4-phosphate cytidylyltransferase